MNYRDNDYQLRDTEELYEAESMFTEFLWLKRHLFRKARGELDSMLLSGNPEYECLAQNALNAETAIIEKYLTNPLFQRFFAHGLLSAYDEGELNGILETLRWVNGDCWGDLTT